MNESEPNVFWSAARYGSNKIIYGICTGCAMFESVCAYSSNENCLLVSNAVKTKILKHNEYKLTNKKLLKLTKILFSIITSVVDPSISIHYYVFDDHDSVTYAAFTGAQGL